jgi:hypothetical protein
MSMFKVACHVDLDILAELTENTVELDVRTRQSSVMLIRHRILPPRAIWASTTTHPARCRYNSSQSKPPTIEPKSTSTSPDSPPDGIPTFQDLGLPTPPPSAPLFSREKLSDEEIRRTGGNLAKLIRDSIRVGLDTR